MSKFDEAIVKDSLPYILAALIRHLNYLYDVEQDLDRKEAILDKKARLLLQLILLEESQNV